VSNSTPCPLAFSVACSRLTRRAINRAVTCSRRRRERGPARGLDHQGTAPELLACKESGGLRYEISAALHKFYRFCAACSVPEIRRLVDTIERWQQPIIAAITTGLSNARSEGYKRIVKHVGRIAFGFRSPNRRRRVCWAYTRQTR